MKEKIGSRIFDLSNVIFMIFLSFIFLYPFIYIVSVSVSDPQMVYLGRIKLFPVGFNDFLAYKRVFSNAQILLSYWNTIKYAFVGTLFTLIICSITAYSLSIKTLKGRTAISLFFAFTMFFSGGMIPNYLLILELGFFDTIWALVVPGAINVWYMVIMRVNFHQIPDSLSESVKIDGGSHIVIFTRIILPLSKAVIAVVALFTLVNFWNSFFAPFIYLSSADKQPLQVFLRRILIVSNIQDQAMQVTPEQRVDYMGLVVSVQMASIMVSIGPIVLAYPWLQRYFVKGMLIGSLKG